MELWIFMGAAVLLALVLLGQKDKKDRELLHKERMAAIERGIPLSEFPTLTDSQNPPLATVATEGSRKKGLKGGLFFVSLGLGMLLAFYFAPDIGLRGFTSLGLIPLFLGFGLLIYHFLLRA